MVRLFDDLLQLVEHLCIVVLYAMVFFLIYATAVYYLDDLISLLIMLGMDVKGKMVQVATIIENQRYKPNYV